MSSFTNIDTGFYCALILLIVQIQISKHSHRKSLDFDFKFKADWLYNNPEANSVICKDRTKVHKSTKWNKEVYMTVGYWWNLEGLVNPNAVAKTSLKVLVKNHLKFFDSSSLTRRTEWRLEEIMNLSLLTHSLTHSAQYKIRSLVKQHSNNFWSACIKFHFV